MRSPEMGERPVSDPFHVRIWFGRFVLGGATFLLLLVAARYIADPVGAVASHAITLGSAEAVTIMRVSGGVFLGVALALIGCLASNRRLLAGLGLLAIVASAILAVRIAGAVVDGPAPFTMKVLKPEVALAIFSIVALVLERRRRGASDEKEPAALAGTVQ